MEDTFLKIINSNNRSLKEAVKYLDNLKSQGYAKDQVYQVLENLRNRLDNEEEDFVLEIMDIVSGWCSPDKEIW